MSALTKPLANAGITAARPIGVADGTMFFDVSLGHPVWALSSSATGWVNSTGGVV